MKKKDKDPCWDTHQMVGMKMKNGRKVPNCVPKESKTFSSFRQVSELKKSTLASYIGKAANDVATKSALTRHFATKSQAEKEKQNFVQARKDDETSNKMFKKSWKRRQNIQKAADKLAGGVKIESVEEVEEGIQKRVNKTRKNTFLTVKGSSLMPTKKTSDTAEWRAQKNAFLKKGREAMREESEDTVDEALKGSRADPVLRAAFKKASENAKKKKQQAAATSVKEEEQVVEREAMRFSGRDSLGFKSRAVAEPKKTNPEADKKKKVQALKDMIKQRLNKEDINENLRLLAQKGIGAERKEDIKVGHGVDYYHPKDGSKHMGKIHSMTDKGYTVKDDKTGEKHTFSYYKRMEAKQIDELKRDTLISYVGKARAKNIKDSAKNRLAGIETPISDIDKGSAKVSKRSKGISRAYDRLNKIMKKEIDESTSVTDYNPKSQGGTRKELIARYRKTKNPEHAAAARRAGATQKELMGEAAYIDETSRMLAKHGDVEVHHQNGIISVKKGGKEVAQGEFDRGSDLFFISHRSFGKGQRPFETSTQIAKHFSSMKEEVAQIDERNKENANRRKMMDAQRGDKFKSQGYYTPAPTLNQKDDQAHSKMVGRAIRKMSREEVEQIDELNKEQGSILNRYIRRATDDFGPRKGREAGVYLALKKKWGDKKYGLDEPKVKAVQREEVDEMKINEISTTKKLDYIKAASKDVTKKKGAKKQQRLAGISRASRSVFDESAKKDKEDRDDIPFAGPYRKVGDVRKDKFGNVVKNRAKHLAKMGMASVTKKESFSFFDFRKKINENV